MVTIKMAARHDDGSAGDADYGLIGSTYSSYRQPEPHISSLILKALGSSRRVLNMGAGAGSYEPTDREIVAIEPSASMRAQRRAHLTRAIDAIAEAIPYPDGYFDAAMATFTVHQWSNLSAGLAEMRRVTSGPVVILSCDPDLVQRFWLNMYAPGVLQAEARRYPSLSELTLGLGGVADVLTVPIPLFCRDGFNEAYYGRPERLLEAGARLACSAWSFVSPAENERTVEQLRSDLLSGEWDRMNGPLRSQSHFDGSLRLIVSR